MAEISSQLHGLGLLLSILKSHTYRSGRSSSWESVTGSNMNGLVTPMLELVTVYSRLVKNGKMFDKNKQMKEN